MRKIAIITGASSGIGEAIAHKFDQGGITVILVAKNGIKIKKSLKNFILKPIAFKADIRKEKEVAIMLRKVIRKYKRVDILVNCAGVWGNNRIEDSSNKEINIIIDTNLKEAIYCTKTVVPCMKKQGAGQIININATAGKTGSPYRSVFCASKFGLSGFSESIYKELKDDGIKVATIYTGMVATKGILNSKITSKAQIRGALDLDDIANMAWVIINQGEKSNIKEIYLTSIKSP